MNKAFAKPAPFVTLLSHLYNNMESWAQAESVAGIFALVVLSSKELSSCLQESQSALFSLSHSYWA